MDLTRKHEVVEKIISKQKIQLENKEIELKTIFSEFKIQLKDEIE